MEKKLLNRFLDLDYEMSAGCIDNIKEYDLLYDYIWDEYRDEIETLFPDDLSVSKYVLHILYPN